MHGYWQDSGSRPERRSEGPKASAFFKRCCSPVTKRLTVTAGILVTSTLAGLVWDFRASGFILAILLLGLAIIRVTGKETVFSSRSKRFDIVLTVGLALFLALFSYIAPA